jgi:hypothetical protein
MGLELAHIALHQAYLVEAAHPLLGQPQQRR